MEIKRLLLRIKSIIFRRKNLGRAARGWKT